MGMTTTAMSAATTTTTTTTPTTAAKMMMTIEISILNHHRHPSRRRLSDVCEPNVSVSLE